ncbi:MAG: recombinational DNA repair protein (RecF pathway) [Candidatus Paceibacteria bacterium]|jgi:recombinational DNA repair protein (RecF pathway)
MAYATYTTKALVCGTYNRNTSDCSYLLFTREAGMLYADARSVREERSRQRYALQDFSLARVSLVKGKRGWKIGSIESRQNYYREAVNKSARISVVSLFRLLRRFVKGEEADPEFFDYIATALTELTGEMKVRSFVLLVVQVRTLSLLGYVDVKTVPEAVRILPPQEIAEQYSADIELQIGKLYTHAVAVSHL